jgi:hypothetical protein
MRGFLFGIGTMILIRQASAPRNIATNASVADGIAQNSAITTCRAWQNLLLRKNEMAEES